MRKFCMYVTPAAYNRGHLAGYLSPNDDLSSVSISPVIRPWKDSATQFDSIEQVNDAIRRYGWINDTSVRPGWTTAYAAEVVL